MGIFHSEWCPVLSFRICIFLVVIQLYHLYDMAFFNLPFVFLTHSTVGSSALRADGTLSRCSSLLVALGGAVSKGTKEEGMELVRKGWCGYEENVLFVSRSLFPFDQSPLQCGKMTNQ